MSLKQATAPILDRWQALPANFRGAVWMLLGAFTFMLLQAGTKMLGHKFDSIQISFFRSFFGGVVVIPFLLKNGLSAYRTPNLPFHIGRGLLGATAIYLMVYAIVNMPLADATAIGFTRSLFMIVLAVLFLGETVRWRRWLATLVGFGGILLMLRPGNTSFQLAALSALGASLCFASAHVCIKKCTSRKDHPLTVQTYYWTTASIAMSVPAALAWVAPDPREWAILIALGLLTGLAQVCTVYSLRAGEATFVYPFDYTRLIWAAVFGTLIFGEPLELLTLAGAAVIIGANLYIARRQALEDRRAKVAADTDTDAAPVATTPAAVTAPQRVR